MLTPPDRGLTDPWLTQGGAHREHHTRIDQTTASGARGGPRRAVRRRLSILIVLFLGMSLLQAALVTSLSTSSNAAVGQGFNLNRSDLRFILRQIKISEEHARTRTPDNPCGTLVGSGADQIPATGNGRELPWGPRTVDGTCNNLFAGREKWGAADTTFPRHTPGSIKAAENGTTYAQKSGTVIDTQPRLVSNLIVDQTADNPAAVEAAGPEAVADGAGNLPIPNVAPDVGLSAPFNSVFTLFGQFFDHGLDLVTKGGGTVFMPLQPGDPPYVAGGRPTSWSSHAPPTSRDPMATWAPTTTCRKRRTRPPRTSTRTRPTRPTRPTRCSCGSSS